MIGILFFILVITGLGIAYECVARRRGDDSSFWHSLWQSFTFKAVTYFFNTSNAKVVMQYMKYTTWICSSVMLGWPAIKAFFSSGDMGFQMLISLDWGDLDTCILLCYLILNTIVIIIYLCKNKGKQQLSDEDKHTLEATKETSDQTLGLVQQNNYGIDKLLEFAKDGISTTIKRLLPDIVEEVKSLRLISAQKKLVTLKNEAERLCPENKELKSSIYLWLGICGQYTNIPECTSSIDTAYECLVDSGEIIPEEILAMKIFSECAKSNFSEAESLSIRLRNINPTNAWGYIATLFASDDRKKYLENLKQVSHMSIRNILKESYMLFQINDCLNELDTFDIEPSIPDTLTISTLSEWILSLYISISKFAKTTFYTFDGANYKTNEVKFLYDISTKFLELSKSTEIGPNLPDIALYNAISGYLYTKDFKWIQELELMEVENSALTNKIMALSMGYYEQGNIDKALKILTEYSVLDSIGIIALRAVLLLRSGKLEELGGLLTQFIDQHEKLPNTHYALVFNIVKCAPSLSSIAEKIEVENLEEQQLFSEYVRALGGLSTDKKYLISLESLPEVFKYYYPIVLDAIDEKQLAYAILSQEIIFGKLDGRGIIYIDILKELGHNAELYRYLQSLRKNQILVPNLLVDELQYAERLHNYNEAVEITGLLLAERPNDPDLVMHRLMSLHHAKESNSVIKDFFEKTRNLNYSVLAVSNITAILFNRGLFKECIDFLYEHTVRCNHQELRDLYFNYHMNPNTAQIIEEEHETVCYGDYILYEADGEEIWEDVIADSNLESLVGKKIGDRVDLPAGYKEKKVIIKGIWTKYYKLLREVIVSIHSNKSKKIWSISIDDLGPNILDGMTKLVNKYNGGKTSSPQEDFKQYENGEIPLISLISSHTPIHSVFSLIFGDLQIKNDSSELNILNGTLTRDKLWGKQFVLDITSCVLIAEISFSLKIDWERRFVVPKSLVDYIEHEVTQLKNQAIHEYLPSTILPEGDNVLENLDQHPLIRLSQWVSENCVAETDDRKLDIELRRHKDGVIDCVIESRLLANKPNRILISEDVYLNQHLHHIGQSIGCESIFRLMFPDRSIEISNKFFEFNYIGISIDETTIYEEYNKYIHQKHNKFDLCIKNLKNNPTNWYAFFKAAGMFLNGLYTKDNLRHSTNLILNIFESIGPQLTIKFYNSIYGVLPESDIRRCLEDAFRVYSSTHVII